MQFEIKIINLKKKTLWTFKIYRRYIDIVSFVVSCRLAIFIVQIILFVNLMFMNAINYLKKNCQRWIN